MSSMEHHANEEYEEATVLVLAKTYPNVSKEYTELVCTAGLRIDTKPYQWIRLYPVPYRLLGISEQYKKWQIIKVRVAKRNGDHRPESYQPDPEHDIEPIGKPITTAHGWRKRGEYLKDFYDQTTACQLSRGAKDNGTQSQSLGIIHPREIKKAILKRNDDYFAVKDQQPEPIDTLFGTEFKTVKPAPFTLKFSYLCNDPACKGHTQSVIDWEVGASGYKRLQERGVKYAENALHKQFIENPMSKDLWFILGSVHKYPRQFMIIGLFYPDKGVVDGIKGVIPSEGDFL